MTRRRYRWNEATQAMEEVGAEWTDAETRAPVVTEGLVYGNLGRSTDGVDISTRRKHQEYCKAAGVTVSSDFAGAWQKAAAERDAMQRGDFDHRARREAIGKAAYETEKRRRK
jgi:hypothetical protein